MNHTCQIQQIRRSIQSDFDELSRFYPFSSIVFFNVNSRYLACITAVAASVELINAINGREEDFTGNYSRTVFLFVPVDYKECGCHVYGCGWIDFDYIADKDKHFYLDSINIRRGKKVETIYKYLPTPFGYRMCVGVPESFSRLKNVLLECLKTADNLLTAYERIMRGISRTLAVSSYSHGNLGRREFIEESSCN